MIDPLLPRATLSPTHQDLSAATNRLTVVYREISDLIPFKNNARTHSKRQIEKIMASIQAFGFTNPVLIDGNNGIIAGHGRTAAARRLGWEAVPTIQLEHMTQAQVQAYVLADNRLAEDAGWDKEILKIELQNIVLEGEIDISVTGFEVPEIDLLLLDGKQDKADNIPETQSEVVSRPGDLWLLGEHRVLCGDARDEGCFSALMQGRKADIVFVDFPYNVIIDGNARPQNTDKHSEFAMASGEMTSKEFEAFLTIALQRLTAWSRRGSVLFTAMDWRHMEEILAAGRAAQCELLNLCVWAKNTGGMGSLYRSQHELFFVFRNGKAAHRNNVILGKYGRNRTNVWNYPSASTLSRQGTEGNLLAMHPTVKPVGLIADALLDCSAANEVVVDSFLGSGSTLLAAERMRRICYGMEIEPRYVDIAIRRWQEYTGERARHVVTGQTFQERSEEVACGR